jgi:hypothetical protein
VWRVCPASCRNNQHVRSSGRGEDGPSASPSSGTPRSPGYGVGRARHRQGGHTSSPNLRRKEHARDVRSISRQGRGTVEESGNSVPSQCAWMRRPDGRGRVNPHPMDWRRPPSFGGERRGRGRLMRNWKRYMFIPRIEDARELPESIPFQRRSPGAPTITNYRSRSRTCHRLSSSRHVIRPVSRACARRCGLLPCSLERESSGPP